MRRNEFMDFSLMLAAVCACLSLSFGVVAEEKTAYADPPMPVYGVDGQGFGSANRVDIEALLTSAGRELWRWFPEYEIEKFVVVRGNDGPIVLYQRNTRGEIVMRLDTQDTRWAQYAYQFAHEFCHILCGYDDDQCKNEWFEETLCETASLFVMRAMAKAWEHDPPYKHWAGFRHALKSYTDKVIESRQSLKPRDVAKFYRKHQAELEKSSTLRDINGAMAVVLLEMFEDDPTRWEAVRWINAEPNNDGLNFRQYLQAWHDAAPDRHHKFIREVAKLYSIRLRR